MGKLSRMYTGFQTGLSKSSHYKNINKVYDYAKIHAPPFKQSI